MKLELKQSYYVVSGNKNISGLEWTYGEETENCIVLTRKNLDKNFSFVCYNKSSGDIILKFENVRRYKIVQNGIIIAKEVCEDGVKTVRCGFSTFEGKITIPFDYSKITECKKHKSYLYVTDVDTGIYDYLGNEIIPTRYSNFHEFNTCITFKEYGNNGEVKSGIYFVKTNKAIFPKYWNIDVIENLCVIVNSINSSYGAFTLNGEVILKDNFNYLMVRSLCKGTFVLYGYKVVNELIVNTMYALPSGKCIIPLNNSFISIMDYGLIITDNDTKLSCLFSFNGEKILPDKYEGVKYLGSDKLLAWVNDEYKIFETSGRLIHSGKYEAVIQKTTGPIDYYKIALYNSRKVFLYIPCLNTFVLGYFLEAHKTGVFEYYNQNEEWEQIPKSMYNNASKMTNLYEYEEE